MTYEIFFYTIMSSIFNHLHICLPLLVLKDTFFFTYLYIFIELQISEINFYY